MSDAEWRLREGCLTYEAVIYAYDQNLLGLGIDRSKAMDLLIDDQSIQSVARLRQLFNWSGLVGFGIMAAALVLSFTWHWWAFLLGIAASIGYWQVGKKVFARLLLNEALRNKDLYNKILEKDGWYFSTSLSLDAIQRTYEQVNKGNESDAAMPVES